MSIKVTKALLPKFEEYTNEIKDLWETHWVTNMGVKHQALEVGLIDYLKVKNLTLFANGHLALECIIAAFNLEGEIITTPFTFASTTHAIVRNGIKPIFCDINPTDYTLDVEKIESLITAKTTAIMPVHVYGNVCDVEAIAKIAKKHNLKVIYDAAHAFGVEVNGVGIGEYGDASMFSFHATKVFNTIEGGAVTYNDTSLKRTLNNLKNFGITGTESVEYVGGNAKMNEFQAAMGICNLRHVAHEISMRQKVFARYCQNLRDISGVKLPQDISGINSNYSYFPIIFDDFKVNRDDVFLKLEEIGVTARKYFYPLTNSFDCYKEKYDVNETPVAKYVSEHVLTLPIYADLAFEDIDRICDTIKSLR